MVPIFRDHHLCSLSGKDLWEIIEEEVGDFPGGPVVKTSPSSAGDAG